MIMCKHCNSEIMPREKYCKTCGSETPENMSDRISLENSLKIKLSLYLLISATGFTYLVLPQNAGVSVPVFVMLQFVCLCFIAPRKKPLLMFIPIFIISLNSFISANTMWRTPNLIVSCILYSVMALMLTGSFSLTEPSSRLFSRTIKQVFNPFRYFTEPVKWAFDASKQHRALSTGTALRVLIALIISVPCLAVLLALLSSADAIFSNNVSAFFNAIYDVINVTAFAKMLCGIIVGFYLFGLVYPVFQPVSETTSAKKKRNGDLLILNILLILILVVYTIFVVIQFKYLFANSSALPYGLTYTYYARRGFFELLLLTGLNITLILITTWLTRGRVGSWAYLTKVLSCYLCAVTMVLLISSFYRMWLYNADDGLTRLRFMVFGFLIFEAIGLLFTFIHIFVPKFNIIAVYACIALVYYLALNVVPMDSIIAKDQIDRYFETGRGGITYVVSALSADAASQVARLKDIDDNMTGLNAGHYFTRISAGYETHVPHWQSWNLSITRFNNQLASIK